MYDFAPNSLQFCTKFITISHQIHYDFAPNLLRLQFCSNFNFVRNCNDLVRNRNEFGAKSL